MMWSLVRPNSAACLTELMVSEPALAKRDHLRVRRLRLQQEGTEVGIIQGMARAADHRAAQRRDRLRGFVLQRDAQRIIDRHEVPALVALRDQRFGETRSIRIGVVDPLDSVRRTLLAGQFGRRRGGVERDLVLFLDDLLHRERDRRVRHIDHHIDAIDIEPVPDDGSADIGLVLVIGGDEFDRLAAEGAAGVLDRHLCGLDRSHAGLIRIQARHVAEDADFDRFVRRLRLDRRSSQNNDGGNDSEQL